MVGSGQRSPNRRCKPITEWPCADRDLWLAALRPGDVLEDGGALSGLSATTRCNIAKGYGRWLTWFETQGRLDDSVSPGDRITLARVREYVALLVRNNATGTIITYLKELARAAKVMAPEKDWSCISRIAVRLRARHEPARPKRHRVVASAVLVDLGLELMARADHYEDSDRRRLIRYRDGLQIALLAARPLRLRNFVALVLGRNVVRRGEVWWIEIEPAETKNKVPIEVPWPEGLVPHLEYYLSEIRPALATGKGHRARPPGDALWLSTHGSSMTSGSVHVRIINNTRAALGRAINPHLFRDCAATSLAIEDPVHVGIASQLLGHSVVSTERYYNQARTVEACREFQACLISLRRSISR